MQVPVSHALLLAALLMIGSSGCVNGRLNMAQVERKAQEWTRTKKQDDGPQIEYVTPLERMQALEEIEGKVDRLSPEEHQRIGGELAAAVRSESDPIIRAQMIRTIARLSTPHAAAVLREMSTASDPALRIAACDGWSVHQGPDAARVLSQVVQSDKNKDVRMAAIRALGELKEPASVSALAVALEDPDPAMQHRAVQSLELVTGKDLGNDAVAWRTHLHGGTPQPKETSLVSLWRSWF